MSSSLSISNDYGLTWKDLGQILTGTDYPTPAKQTGEGDLSVVDSHDGYYYAYCFRNMDRGQIVARAPVANPRPGQWVKFYQGHWDQPGLGGDATNIGNGSGSSVAWWTTTHETAMTGWVPGGLGVRFSADHTKFTTIAEPLLLMDPSEMVIYPVLLDAKTGSKELSNSWLLAYAYRPPYEDRVKRYLVFRDVSVSVSNTPTAPQVGVLLARWYNPTVHLGKMETLLGYDLKE